MTTRKKPAGAPTAPAKSAKKEEIMKLSAVQLDKYNAMQQKELAFQNELVAIRTQKSDLLELLLDSNGFSKEKMETVTNIILNDKNELVITM